MLFAQISDTHIGLERRGAFGRVDLVTALERCIDALDALDPAPAFVLHTGDLVDRRTPEEYGHFLEILGRLRLPFFAIPGNHDARRPMRQAFAGRRWADAAWAAGDGALHLAIEDFPVRVVALDDIIPERPDGALDEEALAWLDTRLGERPDVPTVVALHHPPFATGIAQLDRNGFGNAGRLDALLRRHGQVQRLICGHVHRPITTAFGGTVASAAPSAVFAFAPDLRPEAPLSYAFDVVGFSLHHWDGAQLITHLVPVGDIPPPLPFLKDGKRIDPPEGMPVQGGSRSGGAT